MKKRLKVLLLLGASAPLLTGCPALDSLIGDTVPPERVIDLEAATGDGEVTLTWTDPADGDFDSVEITWQPDGGAILLIAAGTETHTITGLTNGTTYTFSLRTVDTEGNKSTVATISVTPEDQTPPDKVTNLVTTAADGEIQLSWSDPKDGDLEYIQVTWSPDGQEPQLIDPSIESFTASGLSNGEEYTFGVVAVDTVGNRSGGVTATATPTAGADTIPPPTCPVSPRRQETAKSRSPGPNLRTAISSTSKSPGHPTEGHRSQSTPRLSPSPQAT